MNTSMEFPQVQEMHRGGNTETDINRTEFAEKVRELTKKVKLSKTDRTNNETIMKKLAEEIREIANRYQLPENEKIVVGIRPEIEAPVESSRSISSTRSRGNNDNGFNQCCECVGNIACAATVGLILGGVFGTIAGIQFTNHLALGEIVVGPWVGGCAATGCVVGSIGGFCLEAESS